MDCHGSRVQVLSGLRELWLVDGLHPTIRSNGEGGGRTVHAS